MRYPRFASACLAATLLVAVSVFSGSLVAQQKDIPFESAGDFLKLPADVHFGEVAGVATTSTGNIWVYTRSGGANATIGASRTYINGGARLFEFDRTGKFLREIGSGPSGRPYSFLFAQAVRSMPRTISGRSIAPPGWS
jgi:hypothetical protein